MRAVAENTKRRFEILGGMSERTEQTAGGTDVGGSNAPAGGESPAADVETTLIAVRMVVGWSLPSIDPYRAMRLIAGEAFKSIRCLAHCTEGLNLPRILRNGLFGFALGRT